jgi:membrane-associated phospholipid phosphatase
MPNFLIRKFTIMKLIFSLIFFCSFFITNAQNFDINTLRQTNLYRNKSLDNFFCAYSNSIGYTTVGAPISIYAIGIFSKNKKLQKTGINMTISAGINGGFTYLVKQVANRPRPAVTYPFLDPLDKLTRYSFPSGHTSSAFNTATSLCIAYPKWYVILPSYTYASIMAYSRMHMGVHYPSDVFAGALLGTGSAYLSNFITKKLQKNKKTNRLYNKFIF